MVLIFIPTNFLEECSHFIHEIQLFPYVSRSKLATPLRKGYAILIPIYKSQIIVSINELNLSSYYNYIMNLIRKETYEGRRSHSWVYCSCETISTFSS